MKGVNTRAEPHAAPFATAGSRTPVPLLSVIEGPTPHPEPPQAVAAVAAAPTGVPHLSLASPSHDGRAADALAARYRAAIDMLRIETQRLAEQARADAVEIAFQVARKLLETELASNPEPLFGLVRTAIQKLGDARKVTVRVCPADLGLLKSEDESRFVQMRVAQVELVADPTLSPGDCVIESPVGAVDGRLSVRLAELRRAVAEALEGVAA
jgi:flagellar assembly protein FliH